MPDDRLSEGNLEEVVANTSGGKSSANAPQTAVTMSRSAYDALVKELREAREEVERLRELAREFHDDEREGKHYPLCNGRCDYLEALSQSGTEEKGGES